MNIFIGRTSSLRGPLQSNTGGGWTACLLQGALLLIYDLCMSCNFSDTVLRRFRAEPGLHGAQISPMERGSRVGAAAVSLCIPSATGKSRWNSILQLCTNKLMNDNELLIEGAGAAPSGWDCCALNGVLRVVTGVWRLWRSLDPSWSQIISNTRPDSQGHVCLPAPSFTCMNIYQSLDAWVKHSSMG